MASRGGSGWGGSGGGGGAKGRRKLLYGQREGVTAEYDDGTKATIMRSVNSDGEYVYFSKDKFGNYKEIDAMRGRDMTVAQIAQNAKNNGAKVKVLSESDFEKEDYDRMIHDKNKPDYELGIGLPDNREYRKKARRQRLWDRAQRRRR